MKLGAFSVSLAVKDLQTSKDFYEKIGFTQFAGHMEQNYLIMKNGDHVIGLFQGMFDNNILTFNPGWNQDCDTLDQFADVRQLQDDFKAKGIQPIQEAEDGSGPANMMIADPDGNVILFDQHVDSPS